jgi:hypothetical protein
LLFKHVRLFGFSKLADLLAPGDGERKGGLRDNQVGIAWTAIADLQKRQQTKLAVWKRCGQVKQGLCQEDAVRRKALWQKHLIAKSDKLAGFQKQSRLKGIAKMAVEQPER